MRVLSRFLAVIALAHAPIGTAAGAPASTCRTQALDRLRADSSDGFAIYRQVAKSEFFTSWIDCHDAQFGLPTAVHESAHAIAAETDTFPLVDGGAVDRPHEVSAFFPPSRIANGFANDDFATVYLGGGKASSADDFLYLLDELNAYSHDLATAVDLKALSAADESVDHRDGLAALMAFVAVYAARAKASEPETWRGLREPRVATTLAALWSRAERVMQSSCGIPNFGSKDMGYIKRSCAPDARDALTPILGRAPLCPVACLKADADLARRDENEETAGGWPDEEPVAEISALDRPHHPFAIKAGPARHRRRLDKGRP